MAKRMLIDATHPEETRVAVISGNRLEEFDFESARKKQIKGNIYLAKVTRVEPSLQAAFVEYGGNRHGFLAFGEIHPDYFRIPVADREALNREIEAALAEAAQGGNGRDDDAAADDGDERRGDDDRRGDDEPRDDDAERDALERERPERDGPERDGPERDGEAVPLAAERPARVSTDYADEVPPADAAEPPAAPGEGPQDARPATGDATAPGEAAAPSEYPADSAGYDIGAPSGPVEGPAGDDRGADDLGGERRQRDDDDRAESEPRRDGRGRRGERDLPDDEGDDIDEIRRRHHRLWQRKYRIQEVIRKRQIILVQVQKEERGTKGAALTTYISLAGRYCVVMPNTPRGGGISRKITSQTDRRRLKSILEDLQAPEGMAVIVRTAGMERSKPELKRDFDVLLKTWDDIRDRALNSTAPALIYEEANLIKRAVRDGYSEDLDEIVVAGEEGYKSALGFMQLLMPSHAGKVQLYDDPTYPLFHRYQIDGQIDSIHNPTVQLKSGGYIVINPTEALVAIDVNSGRATRERNIEETAYRTNLEAADEIARQLRLRDLAGLIVIDFIDMEDGRYRQNVERRLKDALRQDRARIQVGRISAFGLLEMSRQRLRPSLVEASMVQCPHCGGSGWLRSPESAALQVLRALEEEGIRGRASEIKATMPTAVALYLLNSKRPALIDIERRYSCHVVVEPDDALVPANFKIERTVMRAADAARPPTEEPRESGERREAERERGRDEAGAPIRLDDVRPAADDDTGEDRAGEERAGEERIGEERAAEEPAGDRGPERTPERAAETEGRRRGADDGESEDGEEARAAEPDRPRRDDREREDRGEGEGGERRGRRRGRRGGRRRRGRRGGRGEFDGDNGGAGDRRADESERADEHGDRRPADPGDRPDDDRGVEAGDRGDRGGDGENGRDGDDRRPSRADASTLGPFGGAGTEGERLGSDTDRPRSRDDEPRDRAPAADAPADASPRGEAAPEPERSRDEPPARPPVEPEPPGPPRRGWWNLRR
jgi:ribonuclease E